MSERQQLVRRLLDVAGTTYAAEARIKLADKPMPLFQLLVICMLASKPIDAAIAMGAGRELFKAGLRTPKAVLTSDRQTMIEAFGRAHYVRYDESSATRLTEMAERVRDEHSGDLRELADRSGRDVTAAKRFLKGSRESGIPGPTYTCARCRTCGPGCGRISTAAPPPRRSSWVCLPNRRSSEPLRRKATRGWPPRSSGHRWTTTCAGG